MRSQTIDLNGDKKLFRCTIVRCEGSYLMNVPVTELIWHSNLMSIFIHSEVEMSVEPLKLYYVPMKVIQQAAQ